MYYRNIELHFKDSNDKVYFLLIPALNGFSPNKSVTDWSPITSLFRELHPSQGATVRWDSKQARYKFRANLNTTLILEAIVPQSETWDAVPESKKKILSANQS